MTDLCHAGFFHLHLDTSRTDHPVDLLKKALAECGQEAQFAQSLIVLPEAFNIIEGYYPSPNSDKNRKCVTDVDVEKNLIALSAQLGLCFVVGLISNASDDRLRYSEAVLIDGALREVLSRKTLCDSSPCYARFEQPPEDAIISHRGIGIGALICMDAAAGQGVDAIEAQKERHAKIVKELEKHGGRRILCVPARFGSSAPSAVAQTWNQKKVSIIIANWGSIQFPSVLHLENGEVCLAPTSRACRVHLTTLPSPNPQPPASGS